MDIFDDFFSELDAVYFIENNLSLAGQDFKYSGNGRDFMKEVIRYCAHTLPYSKSAKPVIVVKGRQIGMSTLTTSLSIFLLYLESYKTFGHFFPEIGQARRHSSTTLIEMIEESMLKKKLPPDFLTKKGTQSLTQKDFHKSNRLFIEGLSSDSRRLRGLTITGLPFYDEFATCTMSAYKNSLEAASNTHFGYIDNGRQLPHLVFGTPLSQGTLFEKIWDESDKREFHLKCPFCGHLFPIFYDPINRQEVFTNMKHGTLVACLDRHGIGCQKLVDKSGPAMANGIWQSSLTEDQKKKNQAEFGDTHKFTGYLVPQYLLGSITREAIDYKRQEMTPRTFYNEVLGRFYSNEEDVLTPAQVLHFTTTKPDTNMWELSNTVLDKKTFMGIDWGGRASGEEDNGSGSYTVVTILSLLPTGQLKLELSERFQMTDIDEQVNYVIDLVKKFNVAQIVADQGYGEAQRQRLIARLGIHLFVSCIWSANLRKANTYHEDVHSITSDKHILHENFFDLMRQYKFCFPNSERAEERIEWLREHICNIEIINVEQNGMIKKRYEKKKGKPTDGLASLIYSYLAFQFFKTNKFKQDDIQIPGSMSGKSNFLVAKIVDPRYAKGNTQPHYSRNNRRRR